MERREEGERQDRWLSTAEAADMLGVTRQTIQKRRVELGAKGIGKNYFFDREKVEALKKRVAEANEQIAKLEKTHMTLEELARTLGTSHQTARNYVHLWKLPQVTATHPFGSKRTNKVYVERAEALKRAGQPTAERSNAPEQRDRIVDAALDAYAKGKDVLALHAALKTLTRGDIEKASNRYRQMLLAARDKLGEETSRKTYTLGEAEEENAGEAEQREKAYAAARDRHNDVLLKESALREILDRRRSEILGKKGPGSSSSVGGLLD